MLKQVIKNTFFPNKYSNVTKMMEIREFLKQKSGNRISKILKSRQYRKYCSHFGCFIPIEATIGNGIVFPHGAYGVFISQGAVIGSNCTIFHQVTIGSNTFNDSKNFGVPSIGDNVYVGAGAKIIGKVKVGNNVRIGANAIVVEDVPDNSTVVAPKSVILKHDKPRDNNFIVYQANQT